MEQQYVIIQIHLVQVKMYQNVQPLQIPHYVKHINVHGQQQIQHVKQLLVQILHYLQHVHMLVQILLELIHYVHGLHQHQLVQMLQMFQV